MKELEGSLVQCMTEQHGNHVIQKCVEKMEPTSLQLVLNKITGKVIQVETTVVYVGVKYV